METGWRYLYGEMFLTSGSRRPGHGRRAHMAVPPLTRSPAAGLTAILLHRPRSLRGPKKASPRDPAVEDFHVSFRGDPTRGEERGVAQEEAAFAGARRETRRFGETEARKQHGHVGGRGTPGRPRRPALVDHVAGLPARSPETTDIGMRRRPSTSALGRLASETAAP